MIRFSFSSLLKSALLLAFLIHTIETGLQAQSPQVFRLKEVLQQSLYPNYKPQPEAIYADAKGGYLEASIRHGQDCVENYRFEWQFSPELTAVKEGDLITVFLEARQTGPECNAVNPSVSPRPSCRLCRGTPYENNAFYLEGGIHRFFLNPIDNVQPGYEEYGKTQFQIVVPPAQGKRNTFYTFHFSMSSSYDYPRNFLLYDVTYVWEQGSDITFKGVPALAQAPTLTNTMPPPAPVSPPGSAPAYVNPPAYNLPVTTTPSTPGYPPQGYSNPVTPAQTIQMPDCSAYPGTIPVWNFRTQRGECWCPEGTKWNKLSNRCEGCQ